MIVDNSNRINSDNYVDNDINNECGIGNGMIYVNSS